MIKGKRILLLLLLVVLSLGCVDGQTRLGDSDGLAPKNERPGALRITGADSKLDIQGIAFDGAFFWITNEGSVPPYDAYIFKVDPRTGEVVGRWNASSYAETGATFDGEFLWTAGVHNPNGVQPPWEDEEKYELIYKYSIESGAPVLLERYAMPGSPNMGVGGSIAFDREKNLWVADGIGENVIRFMRLELLSGVEAEYHPGLEDVWSTRTAESHIIPIDNWRVKGLDFILWDDGRTEIIAGGYDWIDGEPGENLGIFLIDPSDGYSVTWNRTWYHGTPPEDLSAGTFDMAWDPQSQTLYTIDGGSDRIYRHAEDSASPAYMPALFGER